MDGRRSADGRSLLPTVSIFQRQVGDFFQVAVFTEKDAHQREAECSEKDEQRRYAEPLDTFDGLKQIFEHELVVSDER